MLHSQKYSIQQYSKRLLYHFHRMLGNNEEKAQDFLQDIFLKVIERPDRFCTQYRFSTWIFTIAHNMCKNEYRSRHVRRIVVNEPEIDDLPMWMDEDHPIEKAVDHQMFQQAVFDELAQMSADHRTTFLLRHQEDYAIQEISAVLNCSEGTTKSRLHYTTRKLAQKLQSHNPRCDERCV